MSHVQEHFVRLCITTTVSQQLEKLVSSLLRNACREFHLFEHLLHAFGDRIGCL